MSSGWSKVLVIIMELKSLISDKLGSFVSRCELSCGDLSVTVAREKLLDFLKVLKFDAELRFNLLVDITAVDWLDKKSERFEVVYHLRSLENCYFLRIKVPVSESDPTVSSLTALWKGALFLEREVWDMFGIKFEGHPDLRRILMYPEFKGHPLRKDYPVQGKQPRVKLRSPEVYNTARDMVRPPLVKINKRKDPKERKERTGEPSVLRS